MPESLTDRVPFPPVATYVLAESCSTCRVPGGTRCVIRRATGGSGFHASRMDKGISRHRKDMGRAPWDEDRTPGRCYCSIVKTPHDISTH